MKNQEEFLLQKQRSLGDGKPQKNASFHFGDVTWEIDGEKVC